MRNSCTYKLAGPVTFRRSSSKILPEKNKRNVGWGSNLQNIEKSLREVYIPDGFSPSLEEKCLHWLEHRDLSIFTEEELAKLRCFAQTDQSGAEALIVAYDCEAMHYRQLFINNVKPHVYAGLRLFPEVWPKKAAEHGFNITQETVDELCDTPIPKLKLNPYWRELDLLIKDSDHWPLTERYYYFAKQTIHSFSYGIQWHTFIGNVLEKSGGRIVLTPDQGKHFLSTIRNVFPEVPDRCKRIESQVKAGGILYNMFGHPYTIWPGGSPPDCVCSDMKEFFAWGPQSTVGEITRTAFSRMQEYIEGESKPYDILADTHDSYLVQFPLADVDDCTTKMKEFMSAVEFTSPIDGAKFRMKSETKIGFSWGDCSKRHPLGLR